MSEYLICRSLTKDNFDQKTSVFTSRRAVLYFLLNTLLIIKKYRDYLCCCSQREQKCTLPMNFTVLNMIFMKICWTLIFWTKYTIDCSCPVFASNRCWCLILNNKFAYILWKDWYTGEKHSIYLEDAIAYKEKIRQN